MEHIRVVLQDLPATIKAFTVYAFDDGMIFYTIFINSRISDEMKRIAYSHEIRHINGKDFNSLFTADQLENICHKA